jgi:predicted PurR-regulated permease PerM
MQGRPMVIETQVLERAVGMAVLALLTVGCFVVLRPFLPAILWALVLALATWPAYRWFLRLLGGRRTLAATVMTLLLATVLVVPLVVIGTSLAGDVAALAGRVREVLEQGAPPPPDWVGRIPLVGHWLAQTWAQATAEGVSLLAQAKDYIGPVRDWLIATGASVGRGALEISLSVLTTFFLYRDGEAGVRSLSAVLDRVAGSRAQRLLDVAGGTLKSVVYGIMGTALAQGILAAAGLWVAGVPGALFLGVVTAFLSIVPVGPPLVWGSAAGWLLYTGQTGWAVFLALWGLLVISSADNLLKPYFISRGSNLPLILVFLGILGGVIAFGFLGLFLGPTLLAVGYTLVREWSESPPAGGSDPATAAPPPVVGTP